MAFAYPLTETVDVRDTLHGVEIADPYRWLENPDDAKVVAWVEEQNKVTNAYLDQCPARSKLKARLTEVLNYERYSCPFRKGNRIFIRKNDGLQNQSVLYKLDSLEAKETLLLDPNKLSDDGTAALGAVAVSENGTYMAYGVSRSGSDWVTAYVKKIADCSDLPDRLEWLKFTGMAWTHDEKGFFYARYPKPDAIDEKDENFKRGSETQANLKQALYYHKLGTEQTSDVCIYFDEQHPKWMYGSEVSDDGKYVLISVRESTDNVNRLFYADISGVDLSRPGSLNVVKLVDNFDAEYSYVFNEGRTFYFQTNLNAPRGKIIKINLDKPDEKVDVVPQLDEVLNNTLVVNKNHLLTVYMKDVKEILRVYDLAGKTIMSELPLPAAGSIEGVSGRSEDTDIFFMFSSFLYPGIVYRYDFTTNSRSVFRSTGIKNFDPNLYQTEQVFYPSKDGTKVPMYIISKKSMVRDGNTPLLLYGYGGFNISLLPSFHVPRLVFISHFGAALAIPSLRGGGEYGEDWHHAGTKGKKQNVFDDFQSAAEYLINHKYTSSNKLIINGGSNGGLLVAACVNQRPDLFAAGVAAVGVLDMLRFHKFTIGYAWCSDYGCADKAEDFEYLMKYSPVHTVRKDRPYPALLLTTGDHDDRVVPLHSYKYIATVQRDVGCLPDQKKPLLIRIETKAGHGAGKPLSKIIDELADVYGFMAHSVGAEWID